MPRGGVSNCQEACLEEGARELGSPAYWPSEFCAQELREGGAGVSPLSPVPFLLFLRRNDGAELPFITCVLGLSSFCLSEWKLPKQHCRGPGRKYVPKRRLLHEAGPVPGWKHEVTSGSRCRK